MHQVSPQLVDNKAWFLVLLGLGVFRRQLLARFHCLVSYPSLADDVLGRQQPLFTWWHDQAVADS